MKKNEFINLIYKIAITALSILLGILMIVFVFIIYFNGKEIINNENPLHQIYNVEIISKYLGYLVIPFILWVLCIIVGIVINYFYPVTKKQKINFKEEDAYYHLKKRIPSDMLYSLEKGSTFRKTSLLITTFISLLCMILPARYLFTFSNFEANEITAIDEAINMAFNVFPWIIGSFVVFGVYTYLYYRSLVKDVILMNEIIKNNKISVDLSNNKDIDYRYSDKTNILYVNIIRACVVTISIVFIVLGILNGGVDNVLAKAVNICTECIGLA